MILALSFIVIMTVAMAFSGEHTSTLSPTYYSESLSIFHTSSTADVVHTTNWDSYNLGSYQASFQVSIEWEGANWTETEIFSTAGNTSLTFEDVPCFDDPGDPQTASILYHDLHYDASQSGSAKITTKWD